MCISHVSIVHSVPSLYHRDYPGHLPQFPPQNLADLEVLPWTQWPSFACDFLSQLLVCSSSSGLMPNFAIFRTLCFYSIFLYSLLPHARRILMINHPRFGQVAAVLGGNCKGVLSSRAKHSDHPFRPFNPCLQVHPCADLQNCPIRASSLIDLGGCLTSRLTALGSLGVAVRGANGEAGGVSGRVTFDDNLDKTVRWFRG